MKTEKKKKKRRSRKKGGPQLGRIIFLQQEGIHTRTIFCQYAHARTHTCTIFSVTIRRQSSINPEHQPECLPCTEESAPLI